WKKVKKYDDKDQLPTDKIPVKKGMMYEENWGEIVSDWLMEDYGLNKKLRRNNKVLFGPLQKLGFKGSYRTLCNFIAEWKDNQLDESEELKERSEERRVGKE